MRLVINSTKKRSSSPRWSTVDTCRALQVALRWAPSGLTCGTISPTNPIMPLTATLISGDRTGAYRYLPRSVQTFAQREEMVEMMEEAGFSDVRQRVLSFGICVAYVAGTG